jgi:hypothetical protein
MNVRLEYNLEFLAGIYYNDNVFFNKYFVDLEFTTQCSDPVDQNVALDRLKFFVSQILQHSVFVDSSEKTAIKKLETAGIKIATLPSVPVDQIIGMMLFCKLNAVMEDRILITQLKISSDFGEHIVYLQHENESVGPFEAKGWWHDPEPNCGYLQMSSSKVVNISDTPTWQNLDFGWNVREEVDLAPTGSNKVVVAFDKQDEK